MNYVVLNQQVTVYILYFNPISMAIYTCNMISFLYYFHIKED